MLASKNLPKAITKPSEGQHWIRVLAAELALRLNDARQLSPNLWPKSLVLHARKGMKLRTFLTQCCNLLCPGYETGRSKQAAFPFTKEVTVDTIASAGDKLWKDLVGNSATLNVTSVQLAFTGINVAEAGQRSIERFLKPASTKRSREEGNAPTHNEAAASFHGDDPSPLLLDRNLPYTCSRCGKIFQPNQSSDDQEMELAKAKMEHSDYHFALDLTAEGPSRSVISASSTSNSKPSKRPKRSSELKGIEKFFRKWKSYDNSIYGTFFQLNLSRVRMLSHVIIFCVMKMQDKHVHTALYIMHWHSSWGFRSSRCCSFRLLILWTILLWLAPTASRKIADVGAGHHLHQVLLSCPWILCKDASYVFRSYPAQWAWRCYRG